MKSKIKVEVAPSVVLIRILDSVQNGKGPSKIGKTYWDIGIHCFTMYNDRGPSKKSSTPKGFLRLVNIC